ncbi:MAG: penicillin-binding protein 2 [candidate division Zixibacteria bacterium]|nr:penicillin-binding protein 2 [candidate division Zixibacteria bacterium]
MTWEVRRQILLGAVVLMLGLLATRLAFMQLVQVDDYRRIANDNQIRMMPIPAPRGRILDRHGVDFVDNRLSYTVAVLPTDFRGEKPRTRLADALGVSREDLVARLRRRSGLPMEPLSVQHDADSRMIARLEERIEEFPGVVIETEPVREYPIPPWAGHLFGYVREVGEDDMKRTDRSGAPLRGLVGASGLEKRYDDVLRGIDGVVYRQVNAFGQVTGPMPGYQTVPPTPGEDLMLAVDADLQRLADSLLSAYVAGTVVAMDIHSGAVLCFVTRPGFDANTFSGGMSSAEWAGLRDDSLHPLLNRAAMGVYPPGSTAKLLTAAAGLDAGVVTESDHFGACTGGYRFGNRVFHCWRPEGHGSLTLLGAIEQSCDVYFYQLGARIGLDTWSQAATRAGFGKPTGIDLPGEAAGVVPSRAYFDRVYGKGEWTGSLVVNLAIGQGEFGVTPLQLLVFYAAMANDGLAMKPHLALATRGPDGHWAYVQPEQSFQLPYSASALLLLREGCRRVVQDPSGTAHAIYDDVSRMAGKTGTAQNPHGNEHAWFVGYAPAEAPQIAVVALVENAGHGSTYAAPICRAIAKAYLRPPVDKGPVTVADDSLSSRP